MKPLVSILIILISFAAISAQTSNTTIENFKWLAGCWQPNEKGKLNTGSERWTVPTSNMMLATSQTVKNGKTVSFEFLRIVQADSGIFYISKPSENKEETPFKLIKYLNDEAVFENPEHDFPQRIIYRLEKDKSLFARIEGMNKGKFMGFDFPMTRISCE